MTVFVNLGPGISTEQLTNINAEFGILGDEPGSLEG